MFGAIIIYTIILLIGYSSSRECSSLNNVEVTLSSGEGLQTITVRNKEEDLKGAYRISVENQNIPSLCKEAIANLRSLDTLIIDSSGIERIEPASFVNLPSLRNLIIVNNKIEEIERDVFGNLLMRKLNLSNNGITTIKPKAFENAIKLEVLDLSSNKLKTFENDWFKYTPKLYRLDLTYNQIASLRENTFANIIKDKQKKDNLELWFMYNSIATIHKKVFNGIEKIEDLWLSYNKLSEIDVEVFGQIQSIETLYLDNNEFTCFDDQFLKHLNAKELDIDGNPIGCECLKKIKALKKENEMQVRHLRISLNCLLSKLQKGRQDNDNY